MQAVLDGTAAAESFEGMPWVPGELQEVIEGSLGCEWYPDDPQLLYRPAG